MRRALTIAIALDGNAGSLVTLYKIRKNTSTPFYHYNAPGDDGNTDPSNAKLLSAQDKQIANFTKGRHECIVSNIYIQNYYG